MIMYGVAMSEVLKKVSSLNNFSHLSILTQINLIENGEFKPINHFVRKVVFTLHDSFKDYIMEIDKPPFSIVRNGWGEFDINITIYFQDINEEPVTKIHAIRIFHHNQNQRATAKKPVVNETYDEIVFCEPTEFFFHMLTDDPKKVLEAGGIGIPEPAEKKEEVKAETSPVQEAEKPEEQEPEMDEDAPAPDAEMQPEEDKDEASPADQEFEIKEEGEDNKEESKEADDVILRSTYEVCLGANNEHKVDVSQFFEEHNDKADLKLLSDALKHLKEETEYLRNEVRNAEKEISEKKEKLRVYDQ
jgi:YEATS domain-containing protein 4